MYISRTPVRNLSEQKQILMSVKHRKIPAAVGEEKLFLNSPNVPGWVGKLS